MTVGGAVCEGTALRLDPETTHPGDPKSELPAEREGASLRLDFCPLFRLQ